jgi:hypothetical protein
MPRPALAAPALAAALLACGGGGGGPPPPPVPYGAPVLLWKDGGCTSSCQTGWYGSPAAVDLDGDGAPEVVWASHDAVALRASDGATLWRGAGAGRSWGGPVVADLDGDGAPEIAVGRGGGSLTVYGAAGDVVRTLSPFGTAEIRALAAADLDGDGTVEILAGRASPGARGQVTAIDASGATRAGWPALAPSSPGFGWGVYNQNLAAADLDGDGRREILAPSDVHHVMAFRRDAAELPANARYGAGKVWSQVGVHVDDAADLRGFANCETERRPNFADAPASIADLDGDGTREVVIVGNVYDCSADPYRSLYRMPFVLGADRSRWRAGPFDWTVLPAPGPGSGPRSEDFAVVESAMPNPVLADLDGDGRKEILFASYDGKVHAYGLDRAEPPGWPHVLPGAGIRFASEPAVADLDGDGRAEVLFTTWSEKAARGTGSLVVVDARGRRVHEVALPAPAGGGRWNGALGAPTLANLDAGPELEVLVGTVATGVVAYRIPGSTAAGIRWGTGRGNVRRDGTGP